MSAGERMPDGIALTLPLRDVLLHDPRQDGRLPTPTDERGIVQFDALVQSVHGTVDPTFSWPSEFNDDHHLHWPGGWYDYEFSGEVNRQQFRNLSINRAYMPRMFHNWIHAVTEPPRQLPSDETCWYFIECERVVKQLFKSAQLSVSLAREPHISLASLEKRLIEEFDNYERVLEEGLNMPREHLPVSFSDFYIDDRAELVRIAPLLGKAAAKRTVRQTTQYIRVVQKAA